MWSVDPPYLHRLLYDRKTAMVLPSIVYTFDNRAGKITIKMFNLFSLVAFAGHRPQSVLWDSLTADAVWRFHCWLKVINNDHILFDVWWTTPSITENLFAMRHLLEILTNSLLANSTRPNGIHLRNHTYASNLAPSR